MRPKPVKALHLAGYTASIYQHQDIEDYNPRTEYDNLGNLYLFPHPDDRCHVPGDEDLPAFDDLPTLTAWVYERGGAFLPVYVWADWIPEVSCEAGKGEHLGYLHCPPERVADEYGTDADATAKALNYLRGELAEFAAWVRGEVYYCLTTDAAGDQVDRVSGLIGLDCAKSEAGDMLTLATEAGEKTPAPA